MSTFCKTLGLAASLTIGAAFAFVPHRAHAAVFYNCGHEIQTSYYEGWVVIDSMSGIANRSDIYVWGLHQLPDGREIVDQQSIHTAIRERQHWGYNYSVVFISGHNDCQATLH